ncbi:hypothetical protein C6B42_13725 [Aeromonas caviae]|nr:hypothetical protein C6B42_13725 [Aeromonas caviae]
MIYRKGANLLGTTVLFEESLKLRPAFILISPKVSGEAQAIDNSVERLSMFQGVSIGMKYA